MYLDHTRKGWLTCTRLGRQKEDTVKRQKLNQILDLTQECLERLWQKDCDFVLSYCAPDISYIGVVEEQFYFGYETLEPKFRRYVSEMLNTHLVNAEFVVVSNSANACVVAAHYLSTTDLDTGTYLQFPQRCTVAWVQTSQGLKIKHIHVSNPMNEIRILHGELVPNEMGQLSQQYMERRVATLLSRQRVVIRDIQGNAHYLALMDILYVQADRKRSIVHTTEGPIVTNESYGVLLSRLPSLFFPVHRSFTVNIDHVRRVGKGRIQLDNGDEVPVPRRTYAEVRHQLYERYKGLSTEDQVT